MPPYKGAKYNKRLLSKEEVEERAQKRREACKRYNDKNREYYNEVRKQYKKDRRAKIKNDTAVESSARVEIENGRANKGMSNLTPLHQNEKIASQ